MSNRIGNSCHCVDTYSPPVRRDRSQQSRTAAYQAEESAALEVRTADGDTVRISFAALAKVQAGARSLSADSAYSVHVSVQGSLDDKETSQIGALLETLVGASRSPGVTSPANPGNFDTLSSFRYGYRAYAEFSQTLSASREA